MNKLLSFFCVGFELLLSVVELNAQWKQLNVGSPWQVWSVAVIGSSVFAGTGAGIYRSTNGGQSWTNVNNAFAECFAEKGSEVFAGCNSGVLKSTDDGITWINPDPALTGGVTHIAANDFGIYASCGGMLRSTDDGASWPMIGQLEFTGLVLDGGSLFATGSGVCKSTDGGNSWSTLTGTGSTDDLTNCIAAYDSTILVGWVGGIIRSTDYGNTWSWPSMNYPMYSGTVFSIVMDSAYSYIGTESGVMLSTDRGVTWESVSSGLPANQVFSLVVAGTDLYATSYLNGVYTSTNNGTNWTYASNGIVGSDVNSISGDGTNVYAVFKYDSICSSTDNGNTWDADTSLSGAGQINEVTVIGTNVYAVSSSGIFVSSDSGKTWSTLNRSACALVQSGTNLVAASGQVYFSTNGGVNWSLANSNTSGVSCLAATGTDVFAAGEGWIYRSTDNGENWDVIDSNLTNISSLAASGSTVVAGRWIQPYPLTDSIPPPPGGLFLSTDNGQTWSTYLNGLPGYGYPQVWAVAINGIDVFAGMTDQGDPYLYPSMFYSSTINIDNWVNTGQGLPGEGIESIYENDSSIFVGIGHEGGIWRAPLSQVTGTWQSRMPVVPTSIQLKQNYPNPFNPTTTIAYSIPARTHVTLTVYNMLGQKVETLLDAVQDAGNHGVNFNASRLASGVYFYRLTSGNYVSTKRMLMIK